MHIKTKEARPKKVEVFKINPAYQKLSKARKLRALGMLTSWIASEFAKLIK